jgi:hypothetical protein
VLFDAALACILNEEADSLKYSSTNNPFDPFVVETGLRLNHALNRQIHFKINDTDYFIRVQYIKSGIYSMKINDIGQWKTITGSLKQENNDLLLKSNIDGIVQKCSVVKISNELNLFTHVSS